MMTELEDLKKEISEMEVKDKENTEMAKLRRRKSQLEHPKTVKFANAVGSFGRGLGKLIKGTPKVIGKGVKKLNEMDENLAKKQKAERERLKKKGNKPMSISDAANLIE